ncbi:MAG: tlde1 domain-containing protein [Chloroflexota bacterium]
MSSTQPVLPQPPQAKPQGYWEYSQSKGTMTHVAPDGTRKLVGTGYSGVGSALDDTAAQDVGNTGPIPRGAWTIGPQQDHPLRGGRHLTAAMPLSPAPGNASHRNNYWIHGDTAEHNHTASEGCIVLSREARDAVAGSGDTQLQVVYP